MRSAEDIRNHEFLVSLRGYDRDEVKAYLRELAQEADERSGAELRRAAEAEADAVRGKAIEDAEAMLREAGERASAERRQVRTDTTKLIADAERRAERAEARLAETKAVRDRLVAQLLEADGTLRLLLRELGLELPGVDVGPVAEPEPQPEPQREPAAEPEPDGVEAPAPDDEVPEATPDPVGLWVVPVDGIDPLGLRAQALGPLHPKLVRGLLHHVRTARVRLRVALADDDAIDPDGPGPINGDVELRQAMSQAVRGLLDGAHQAAVAMAARLAGARSPRPVGAAADLEQGLVAALTAQLDAAGKAARRQEDDLEAQERLDSLVDDLVDRSLPEQSAVALLAAWERGLHDGWAALGITHRRWLRSAEPPCEDPRCVDNARRDGIPLSHPFPSGHRTPPVGVGCACSTLPDPGPAGSTGAPEPTEEPVS